MHKPFAVLETLVREGRITFAESSRSATAPAPAPEPEQATGLPEGLSDADLFEHAMKDVKALGWSAVPLHPRAPQEIEAQNDEEEALRALQDFLRNGNPELELTAEYIEAAIHPAGQLYLQDLRSGRFSVQAHLDLHGMNQQEARFALDEFIIAAIRARFGCVRVIHGRGRHSVKHHPVLKESIQRWLCGRRLGRHVIAYTSARRCDGGGGAVYVLLRY
jgi:DNA-nicking Smr family endonuclease